MIDRNEEWEYADRVWKAKYNEADPGIGPAGVDPAWYANCQTGRDYGFVKQFDEDGHGEYEITDIDKFGRAFMRQGHDDDE